LRDKARFCAAAQGYLLVFADQPPARPLGNFGAVLAVGTHAKIFCAA